MAKQTPAADATPAITLTLNEYCIRLSRTDKRVELIAAFESAERRAGKLIDTADGYAGRYTTFINQPA